ncbi:TonB-dependent receptor [Sphingomonas profundi]|uniref:TonB-dependent receptor n=1 Tax=Alterirhizorhabdus profundi TaxID=2681549 RepID=UPI0018D0D901|nr:TonB-dependent receptor [Sphingomonas profundi]
MKRVSRRLRRLQLSALGSASFLGLASPVFAQSATPPVATEASTPVASAAASDDPAVAESGLQDIVVTARKREERLRDVPVAIVAVSGATLSQNNVVRLTDLTTLVPNFQLSLAAAAPVAAIRGFGTYGTTFAQSVGKFTDNISYGRDVHARLPLFDIEQLEVLKGPQVLLYGNSTTAGALNIVTRRPGTTLSADGSASYEFNYNETQLDGGVTVPLNDWASVRAAGFLQRLDKGWLFNTINGRYDPRLRNWAGRVSLRLTPASGTTVDLKAEVDRTADYGSSFQPITQGTNPARQLPDVTLDDRHVDPYNTAPFFANEFQKVRNQTYQMTVAQSIGDDILTSTTGYVDTSVASNVNSPSGNPDLAVALFIKYRQFSQELRYSGEVGILSYTVGGYYENYRFDGVTLTNFNLPFYRLPAPAVGKYTSLYQRSDSYSGFADLTANVTSKLSISAGARYSIIRQKNDQSALATNLVPYITSGTTRDTLLSFVNPARNAVLAGALNSIVHTFEDIPVRENHFQPQVIAQFKPNSLTMLYAKFVKGNKVGGVDINYSGSAATGATPQGARFGPESANSYEVGIKGVSSDRKLEYSLDGFWSTIKNLQTSSFIGNTVFTTNVGKAQSRGVEATLSYRPVPDLRLDVSANYLDTEFQDFPRGVCTVAQANATPAGTACQQNLSGRPTPYSSKFSGTVAATYTREIGGVVGEFGLAAQGRTRYNSTTTSIDPLGDQKGFVLLDANLSLSSLTKSWKLSLFARNLTDYQFKEYGTATPLVPGAFSVFISRGRTVGLRLSTHY